MFTADNQCSVQLNLAPLLVVRGPLSVDSLQTTMNNWLLQDDVISNSFFTALFLPDVNSSSMVSLVRTTSAPSSTLLFSSSTQFSTVDGVIYVEGNNTAIPNGPYFVSTNYTHINFYQVYRLYRDYTNSFMYGIIPTENDSFETIHAASLNDNTPTIAVPSRLYYTITEAQPLAGIRVVIKDIYDIVGTKRGCGNRAFFELYPVANTSAFAIQRLIDLGAILIGKTKTTQFAHGELATSDWVDYHCPFNPRADGYQQPSGSSTGSASSIAAYTWVDIAIGSDTGGSIRQPAGQQGLYSIRPSHGAISLNGVMPLNPNLDTAAFMTRDATLLATFAKVWYNNHFNSYSHFPKMILYSNEFLSQSPALLTLFETFANRLANFLGANETTLFDISSSFAISNITNGSLDVYYNETYITLIGYYQYYNLGVPFMNDYKAAYDGRTPFINPIPLYRWQYGFENASNTLYETQLLRKNQFSNWWNNVVQPSDPLTCSQNIFLYPSSNATVSNRNIYLTSVRLPLGFSRYYISPFSGNPEITVPIGQSPYNSTITMTTEYLPATVSIIAHVGCDYMLLELVRQLQNAGILRTVKTGRMAF